MDSREELRRDAYFKAEGDYDGFPMMDADEIFHLGFDAGWEWQAWQACDESKQAEIEALRKRYEELLYAVSCKYPNESRHETALRYIQERENREVACGSPKESRQDV